MTLWGGRFEEDADAAMRKLNDSLPFDVRLVRQDIRGSEAYCMALQRAGILTEAEAARVRAGLHIVSHEVEEGRFLYEANDEDVHTAVERRLTELIGPLGGKLHTGRSRNDQVATDFRLWTLDALNELDDLLYALQIALIDQAEAHLETLMPGYTHLQPAQPITVAHWLMSFFWMLARDRDRLQDTRRRTSVSPLGSGALAGNPFAIDREALAKELGFEAVSQNSLDAVSDRDFVAEVLFTQSLLSIHLSRLAEDILIYSNPRFGFITLDDRYSTGSSLMPQKRNADPMELARGKAGRIIGHLTGILITLKGLPSGYNKDLQEDKEPLFDACDTLRTLLPVVTAIVQTLQLHPDKMRAALNEEMLATDLADYLVQKGLPFRDAHHVVGQVVRVAQTDALALSALPLEKLRAISALFAEDVMNVFDFEAAVRRKNVLGSTAPDAVKQQIATAKDLIKLVDKPIM